MDYLPESDNISIGRRELDDRYAEQGLLRQENRQIAIYIASGLHASLGLTEEEYAARFPPIGVLLEKPLDYDTRYDRVLLIDTEVSLEPLSGPGFTVQRAEGLGNLQIVDLREASVFNNPYLLWVRQPVEPGKEDIGYTLSATLQEVLAFAIMHPDMHKEGVLLAAQASRVQPGNRIPVVGKSRENGVNRLIVSSVPEFSAHMPLQALPVRVRW